MKLLKSSKPLKRPKVLLRHVKGDSMQPALAPGQLVVGTGVYKDLKAGDIIIFKHEGLEKIKRISKIEHGHLFVVGDNPKDSKDSRDFGWITSGYVLGKVVWPKT